MNTHWHGDHVYGNQAYREAFPGVRFVGHAALFTALSGPGSKMLADDRARLPDLVAALDARLLLPAHGGVQRDGRLLNRQRALFRALSRRVSAAVEEGRSLGETRAAVELSDVRQGQGAAGRP